MRTSRTGITKRPSLAVPREADAGARDALADLADWLTDSATGTIRPLGGETLAVLKKLLVDGDGRYLLKADHLIEALRRRNSRTFGDDIPANHVDPHCGDFHALLDALSARVVALATSPGR